MVRSSNRWENEQVSNLIILNGDHAEFELEHANTPPHERPDWPLPSFDAKDWAAHFVKTFPDCGIDEGTMIGWFANALMRGYDEHAKRSNQGAKGRNE
jgi:hypothetical protein